MPLEIWNLGAFMYRVSLLLLYPTLLLLGAGLLTMMWNLGGMVYDAWLARSLRRAESVRQLRDLRLDDRDSLLPSLQELAASRRQHPQVRRFARLLVEEIRQEARHTLAARVRHLAGQVQARLAWEVNQVRVLVRLGPLLGLAGTLIPLGPGLMALSQGNLGELSAQLVVAFSTTVVGLLIGGVSYLIAMARAHTADLVAGDVELLGELVCALLELEPAPNRLAARDGPRGEEASA